MGRIRVVPWSIAVTGIFNVLILARSARAAYPVTERLCDTSFENCRTQILDLIDSETQTIDVAFWFMEDPLPLRDETSGGILHWKLMIFGGRTFVNFSAGRFGGFASSHTAGPFEPAPYWMRVERRGDLFIGWCRMMAAPGSSSGPTRFGWPLMSPSDWQ